MVEGHCIAEINVSQSPSNGRYLFDEGSERVAALVVASCYLLPLSGSKFPSQLGLEDRRAAASPRPPPPPRRCSFSPPVRSIVSRSRPSRLVSIPPSLLHPAQASSRISRVSYRIPAADAAPSHLDPAPPSPGTTLIWLVLLTCISAAHFEHSLSFHRSHSVPFESTSTFLFIYSHLHIFLCPISSLPSTHYIEDPRRRIPATFHPRALA